MKNNYYFYRLTQLDINEPATFNPFHTSGNTNAVYTFRLPAEKYSLLPEFIETLKDAGMETETFAAVNDKGLAIETKSRFSGAISHEHSMQVILPIVKRFGIGTFVVYDGDLTVLDSAGDIISWMSSDLIFPDD